MGPDVSKSRNLKKNQGKNVDFECSSFRQVIGFVIDFMKIPHKFFPKKPQKISRRFSFVARRFELLIGHGQFEGIRRSRSLKVNQQ